MAGMVVAKINWVSAFLSSFLNIFSRTLGLLFHFLQSYHLFSCFPWPFSILSDIFLNYIATRDVKNFKTQLLTYLSYFPNSLKTQFEWKEHFFKNNFDLSTGVCADADAEDEPKSDPFCERWRFRSGAFQMSCPKCRHRCGHGFRIRPFIIRQWSSFEVRSCQTLETAPLSANFRTKNDGKTKKGTRRWPQSSPCERYLFHRSETRKAKRSREGEEETGKKKRKASYLNPRSNHGQLYSLLAAILLPLHR